MAKAAAAAVAKAALCWSFSHSAIPGPCETSALLAGPSMLQVAGVLGGLPNPIAHPCTSFAHKGQAFPSSKG